MKKASTDKAVDCVQKRQDLNLRGTQKELSGKTRKVRYQGQALILPTYTHPKFIVTPLPS